MKNVFRGGQEICHEITILELMDFLKQVDDSFPVPISRKTNLHCYARKLFDKASFCCIRREGKVVSLACGYANEMNSGLGYISMIATLPEYRGRRFASLLLSDFIAICKGKGFKGVHLYAVETNVGAMMLYRKAGFSEYFIDNEPRPLDKHLVLYFQ